MLNQSTVFLSYQSQFLESKLWQKISSPIVQSSQLYYYRYSYLDSDRFKVFGNVDENRDEDDRNGELDAPPAHRLSGDGGAVVVGMADGHVALVGDGDHHEDRCAKDDVRRWVDQVGESVAVPVKLKLI